MKVLVTGGAGFIGSHTVDFVLDKGFEVSVIDNLYFGRKENVNNAAEFHKFDIRETDKVLEVLQTFKPDCVLHLAAYVSPSRSVKDPISDAEMNIKGTMSLCNALQKSGSVSKIIVASTQAAYGEGKYYCQSCNSIIYPDFRKPSDLAVGKFELPCPECNAYPLKPIPTDENTRQKPSMPYGVSKLAEEKYILSTAQLLGIDGISLRYFNVYGPRQSSQGLETAVVAIFFSKILKLKQSPVVFEDGGQTRDFVYVSDVVEANYRAIVDFHGISEFNVGYGEGTSILDVANKIKAVLGSNTDITVTSKPRKLKESGGGVDTRHCFADLTKVNKKLNWKPKVGLKSGLRVTADWATGNEDVL